MVIKHILQDESTLGIPINWVWFFFIVPPIVLVLFLCSETFAYVAAPFVTPMYFAPLLDPEVVDEMKRKGGGEISRDQHRFLSTFKWLCTLLGGAMLMNSVAATNGFHFGVGV
mgnify:CR=1 FL=1